MGKARRLKKLKKRNESKELDSIYKDEKDEKEEKKKQKMIEEMNHAVELELKKLGLPTEFSSSKGKHIEGQINVEARRTGMIRKYQSFQRRRLKQWQMTKIRGSKVKQRKNAAKVI